MKIILTESQFNKIIEEQVGLYGGMPLSSAEKFSQGVQRMDPKTYNTLMGIATSFIPFVGPLVSAGFMTANFKSDYDKAQTTDDKKRIVLAYLCDIAIAVGLGKIIKSVGILGHEGMKSLSKGIYLRKPLSPRQLSVIRDLSDNSVAISQVLQQNRR